MSWDPARTCAVPSGKIAADADAGRWCAGYDDVARPQPTRTLPSFIERGSGLRLLQPKASAARR